MSTESQPAASEYNTDFLKSPAGLLRVCEAAAALGGLISASIGLYCVDDGRFGYYLFVVITSFIQAILVIILIVLRLEPKITFVNLPLTLLVNDTIVLASYFLTSILVMPSIGNCYSQVTARIFASLFSITNFLVLVGLVYMDFNWWKGVQSPPKDSNQENNGETLTETSPTVLTLR